MITYRLGDGLSFCRIDGHFIFLDTNADRYLRLPDNLEGAFESYLQGSNLPDQEASRLIKHGILIAAPAPPPAPSPLCRNPAVPDAARSALELDPIPPLAQWSVVELFTTVCRTQFQLKTGSLNKILDKLLAHRALYAPAKHLHIEEDLLRATHTFMRARKLVPLETCCLLDSISLTKFLSRRRLHANIVFGVTNEPFSAHCWVQVDDLILNDAIGNTRSYTVIRVI